MNKITIILPADTKKSIFDLKSLIIQFLIVNGMDENHAHTIIKIRGSHLIDILPDCANSEYTRALALFQLILSKGNSQYYLEYRLADDTDARISLVTDGYQASIEKICSIINANMNIEVHYLES